MGREVVQQRRNSKQPVITRANVSSRVSARVVSRRAGRRAATRRGERARGSSASAGRCGAEPSRPGRFEALFLCCLWFAVFLGAAVALFIASLPDPVRRHARRPAAEPHHPRLGRHRARGAGLAARPCPARQAAALSDQGGDRHRGPPLLSSFRRRSARAGPRGLRQFRGRRRGRGRLHRHPAARQESVPEAGTHHRRGSWKR